MKIIEPGLLRIFRYFTAIAMVYFAALVLYGQFELFYGLSSETIAIQAYLNLLTYVTLFVYLSVPWFRRRTGRYYLPIAIIFATGIPIFSNLIYLVNPETTDFSLIISRSWMLFPILLIPLVITAWQYPFRFSIYYITLVALVEMTVLYPFVQGINFNTIPILGMPIIQAFSYGIVSNILNEIVNEQRAQKRQLVRANVALSEYADTMEKLATTRERNRLARELHDTLAHTLSGISVNLEALKIMVGQGQDPDEIVTMLDHALLNTRTGLDETRRTLKDLQPKTLEDLGLRVSLIELVEDAARRSGFEPHISLPDDFPNFSSSREKAVYRIVQEAMQNIVLHANAQNVTLKTHWQGSSFHLELQDDGKGYTPSSIRRSESFGVHGMQERAELSGGHLTIESTLGAGTHIHLRYEAPHDSNSHL
ncbi:MAG: sensor histidine kinase [Anaerolineales bacterium]